MAKLMARKVGKNSADRHPTPWGSWVQPLMASNHFLVSARCHRECY